MSSRPQQLAGLSVASSSSAAAPAPAPAPAPSQSTTSSSITSGLHPSTLPQVSRQSAQGPSQARGQQTLASTNPPSSTSHRSIFKFRERRGQWLTFFGLVAACVFGIPALKYAADSRALAVWEAEKDYQLYCQSLQVTSQAHHQFVPTEGFPVISKASSYGLCFNRLEDASTASLSFTGLLPEQLGQAEARLERRWIVYRAG